MSIENIEFIPVSISADRLAEGASAKSTESDFSIWFDRQFSQLQEQLAVSDEKLRDLAIGKSANIHDVMISLEKAKLSMELVLQVRNKALEAYQELMRTQL